jgi:hypothetical protein
MRKLNKTQRYLQTLGALPAIGRHVKGERNLHPYHSLANSQSAKGVKDSSRGLNGHKPQRTLPVYEGNTSCAVPELVSNKTFGFSRSSHAKRITPME